MKKIIMTMLVLLVAMTAGAQNADKLYKEGKALYDAKDYAAAVPKLQAAAEKGHRKAQYRLGRCYAKGRGVTENDATAYQWYMKSAEQDYVKAQFRVGKCLKDGNGVAENRQQAVVWFTKAAKQDHAEAQYYLGKAYLKGKGVAADERKARSWLLKAVNNPDGGSEILEELRQKAANGNEDARAVLSLVGKK